MIDAFVAAWERADVPATVELVVEDAGFSMTPLPAWLFGSEGVGRFLAERIIATPSGWYRRWAVRATLSAG